MFIAETSLRVRYAETDQMGFVYYGQYATYYEVARVESIRALGFSYKEMEKNSGVLMPVLEHYMKYLKPANYDDLLRIKVCIPMMPTARIKFEYEIFNQHDEKISEAWTSLVFLRKQDNRPTKMPEELKKLILPFFSSNIKP